MESAYNEDTREWFDVSDEDYDILSNQFGIDDVEDYDSALSSASYVADKLSRQFSEAEIRGIFDIHAEYCGIDVEMQKNEIVGSNERYAAKTALQKYIKSGKAIGKKNAKVILKVMEAFESPEFKKEY